LSLGIETMGGLMDVLIPRNSKVPSKAARQYTTQKDGQSGMRISVFQGERDLVKDNRKLAEFSLSGIPAMPAGLPKVEISFLINADGILTVKARELRSGAVQEVEVTPQYGLTDAEVEKMLMDSITHAQDDIKARALAEARAEGTILLETTEKFLEKNKSEITPQEEADTLSAMQSLRLALEENDKDKIQALHEKLNEVSRPYAERIMDKAVGMAMKGRQV
jgi:molecular chaperone HscA